MGVELKIWERSYPKHSCVKEKPETVKPLTPYFSVNCFPHGGLSRAVLSGPDGLADYRAHVLLDKRPIANYQFTTEGSYDADYLWRCTPLPGTPVHLRPRSAFAGEIGWHTFVCRDPDPPRTGHQILTSEFWRQSEDRGSHRCQDVWYPGPGEVGKPEQSYYFDRFPSTGPRRRRCRTTFDSRTNMVGSSMTSRFNAPQPCQPRVPSATKNVDSDDANIVSVEQSEDGGGSYKQGGSQTENGRLLKSRQSNHSSRKVTENGSSSYTTYMRLPTPASSQAHQP